MLENTRGSLASLISVTGSYHPQRWKVQTEVKNCSCATEKVRRITPVIAVSSISTSIQDNDNTLKPHLRSLRQHIINAGESTPLHPSQHPASAGGQQLFSRGCPAQTKIQRSTGATLPKSNDSVAGPTSQLPKTSSSTHRSCDWRSANYLLA